MASRARGRLARLLHAGTNFDVVIAEHERLMDLLAKGSTTIEKDMESHILRLGMGSGKFRAAD